MKKEKKVLTKCVEAKKVKEFFNEISDLITSGHDKVWTSKDENGEMNFIVGNSRVNIRINASMMKGDKSITNKNIFVTSERKHTDTESGEYNYNISYLGNYELCELTAEEVVELIACLQNALQSNGEKGVKL